MIREVFVGGKPYLLDEDGTMLPPVMGGQWGGYRDPGFGAGTAPTPAPAGGQQAGPQKWDIRWVTNSVGLLEMQEWDGTRWVATGDVRNPLPATGGGGGGGGGAGAQWRPGELELEQQALQQRLQELQMGFDADIATATAAHDRAIELLEMELANASELQAANIQAEIDLENLRHENDMAELEIRIEAERKNVIYGEVGATKRTLIQEQGAMKRELLGLGPDPFAQAAGLSGQATRGVTPQAQAVGQARAFINQPLPQVNFDMPLPQMEQVLGGMQGMQPPNLGGFGIAGGMAGGGTVKTKKGKQQSVIVGEAGKPEVVTGSDFKVTPLAGTAQFGARIGGVGRTIGGVPEPTPPFDMPILPGMPTFPRSNLDPSPYLGGPYPNPRVESILQNLAPMYAGSPFGQVPTAQGYGGIMGPEGPIDPSQVLIRQDYIPQYGVNFQPPSGMSPMDTMSALGIAPQLLRTGGGRTYFIQEGKRHYIPGGHDASVLLALGLNPSQVVTVLPEGVDQFEPGGVYTGQGTQAAGATTGQTGYGALGVPLIEPTSGALLMSPHKIAENWSRMTPGEKQNILSAYAAAGGSSSQTGFGLGPQNVLDMIQTFTPQGRGYGRRIGGIGGQF